MGKRLLRFLTLVRATGDLGWKQLLIVELGLKESKRCVPLEFHKPMNKGFMGMKRYFQSKFTSETQMRNEDLVTLGDEKDKFGKKCLSK